MASPEDTGNKRTHIRPHVYTALKETPGEILSVEEVRDRAGLDDRSLSQISTALGRIVEDKPEWGVRRAGRGMYVYSPNEEKKARADNNEIIMRTLRVYEDGRMVLEGTDGEIYLAQKIDALWSK